VKATRLYLVYLDMTRTDDLAALADNGRTFGEVSEAKESGEAIFFDERTKEVTRDQYRAGCTML